MGNRSEAWWCSGKESACQCRRHKRWGFNPWIRKIPRRRKWQPTVVFLPGKSHGQRSLVGYSLWDHKESDTTEWLIRRQEEEGRLQITVLTRLLWKERGKDGFTRASRCLAHLSTFQTDSWEACEQNFSWEELRLRRRDFPGSPEVKTLSFYCKELSSIPG